MPVRSGHVEGSFGFRAWWRGKHIFSDGGDCFGGEHGDCFHWHDCAGGIAEEAEFLAEAEFGLADGDIAFCEPEDGVPGTHEGIAACARRDFRDGEEADGDAAEPEVPYAAVAFEIPCGWAGCDGGAAGGGGEGELSRAAEFAEGELRLDGRGVQEGQENADGQLAFRDGAGGAVLEEELSGEVTGLVFHSDVAEVGEAAAAGGEVGVDGGVVLAFHGAAAAGELAGDVEGEIGPGEAPGGIPAAGDLEFRGVVKGDLIGECDVRGDAFGQGDEVGAAVDGEGDRVGGAGFP